MKEDIEKFLISLRSEFIWSLSTVQNFITLIKSDCTEEEKSILLMPMKDIENALKKFKEDIVIIFDKISPSIGEI